jgi:hypothetical protein
LVSLALLKYYYAHNIAPHICSIIMLKNWLNGGAVGPAAAAAAAGGGGGGGGGGGVKSSYFGKNAPN